MPQQPINLKQFGISLDDIVVHLQDTAVLKKEIVKEIDKEAVTVLVNQIIEQLVPQLVSQVVSDEIAKLPPPPEPAPLELKLDEESIRKIVVKEIAKIPPPPEPPVPVQKVINQVVEKIDVAAVKHIVGEQLKEQIIEKTKDEIIRKVFVEEFTNSAQSIRNIFAEELPKNTQFVKDIFAEEFLERNPPPLEPRVLSLDEYKVDAKQKIDEVSSQIRTKYVTDVPGQEALYAEKVEEATDFISEGYKSDLNTFPLIHAEVKATELTPKQVADGIIKKKSEWIHANAKIEEHRLRAKRVIESKKTTDKKTVDKITRQTIQVLNKL